MADFDLRYSRRLALGRENQERAMRALLVRGAVGKRLTYRRAKSLRAS